jgi:hypothetical protein
LSFPPRGRTRRSRGRDPSASEDCDVATPSESDAASFEADHSGSAADRGTSPLTHGGGGAAEAGGHERERGSVERVPGASLSFPPRGRTRRSPGRDPSASEDCDVATPSESDASSFVADYAGGVSDRGTSPLTVPFAVTLDDLQLDRLRVAPWTAHSHDDGEGVAEAATVAERSRSPPRSRSRSSLGSRSPRAAAEAPLPDELHVAALNSSGLFADPSEAEDGDYRDARSLAEAATVAEGSRSPPRSRSRSELGSRSARAAAEAPRPDELHVAALGSSPLWSLVGLRFDSSDSEDCNYAKHDARRMAEAPGSRSPRAAAEAPRPDEHHATAEDEIRDTLMMAELFGDSMPAPDVAWRALRGTTAIQKLVRWLGRRRGQPSRPGRGERQRRRKRRSPARCGKRRAAAEDVAQRAGGRRPKESAKASGSVRAANAANAGDDTDLDGDRDGGSAQAARGHPRKAMRAMSWQARAERSASALPPMTPEANALAARLAVVMDVLERRDRAALEAPRLRSLRQIIKNQIHQQHFRV